MHGAACHRLLLERQHAKRNIYADTALLMTQQGYLISARKLLGIGDSWHKTKFDGNME